MKRRDFLRVIASTTASIPILVNGIPAKALSMMELPPECDIVGDRVLVLIQMRGGNDGLNTTLPINEYDTYANYRDTTRLNNVGQSNGVILLDSTLPDNQQIGLHPSMVGLKELYDQGSLNIVQMVGYPSHNLSHFKSTDLMLIGSDGEDPVTGNGWMADYLSYTYPNVAGNPTDQFPDPIGIQLGDVKPSLGFHSEEEHGISINLARQDPNGFFSLINSLGGLTPETIPNSDYGDQLEFIVNQKVNAEVYSQRIADVFNAGTNSSNVTYPNTYLANQLRTVARLLSGGSKTKVFLVDLTGFDTHANQVVSGSPHNGTHTELLLEFSDAVKAFQDDISQQQFDERVLTVTFSEFGRKAIQNGTDGTDHGNYAPMFVIGTHAKAGVTGVNADLSMVNQDTGRFFDNQIQHDYRQVYTTALQDWLGTDDAGLGEVDFSVFKDQKLPIIDEDQVVSPDCYIGQLVLPIKLNYFIATVMDNEHVLLEWQTLTEENSSHFEVQRSRTGIDFQPIGQVNAAGNSSEVNDYQFIDHEPYSGLSFYRLKMVDQDQTHTYSPVEQVELSVVQTVSLSPNPVKFTTVLRFTSEVRGDISIDLFDLKGNALNTWEKQIQPGFERVELNCAYLPTGMYIIRAKVTNQEGELVKLIQEKIVKQ